MQRFKSILLLRGHAEARERAAALAKENRARLTAMDVVEHVRFEGRTLSDGSSYSPKKAEQLALRQHREQLQEYIAPIREEGLRVNTKVVAGKAFLEIIREVVRNEHDLVIMTAEGKSGLRGLLFGSTSLHLIRKCPCPVWVIKPVRRKRFARILAAVDPDTLDNTIAMLNREILDIATSLAVRENAKLDIVSVWSLPFESFLHSDSRTSKKRLQQLLREERAASGQRINSVLELYPLENIQHEVYLVKGDPKKVIPELIQKTQPEVIVMGTVTRTGVPGILIGNTAETILQRVDCSVLTVKPVGFVTPVSVAE